MAPPTREQEASFFSKAYNPFLQAGLVYAVILLFSLAGKGGASETFPWLVSTAFVLFFAIFNSVLSLSAKDLNQYWGRSIAAFILLAGAGIGTAWGLSGIAIDDAGSYRWLYMVVGISYLVFLSLLGAMKNIVEFAQREEWNRPRRRNRDSRGRKR